MRSLPDMYTVVLLAFQRSGSTWLRYIIEALTGRPTLGRPPLFNPDDPEEAPILDPPIHTRMEGLEVDPDAVPSAVKRHALWQMEEGDGQRPLIVVVRNYKECLVRHSYYLEETGVPFALDMESRFYMETLAYYVDHEGSKLLLYYEDLLRDPVRAITSLARFLEIPEEVRDGFLERYEEHRDRSIQNYPSSHTLGKATIHHALRLSPQERRAWDRQLQGLNPEIYERYLTRYRETD